MSFAGWVGVIAVMLLGMVALGIGKKSAGGTAFSCLVALGVLVCSPIIFAYVVSQVNGAFSKPVQRDFYVLMHGMKWPELAEPLKRAGDVKEGSEKAAAAQQQLRNQCLILVSHSENLKDKTPASCSAEARAGGEKYQACMTLVIKQYGTDTQTLQAEGCGTNPQKEIDDIVAGTAAATACGYFVRVNAVIDLVNRLPRHPVHFPFFSKCPLPDESIVN